MANKSSPTDQAGPPSEGPKEDDEKEMYYLPYDHEYWDDKDVEDVISLAESSSNRTRAGTDDLFGTNRDLATSFVVVLVLLALLLVLTVLGNALVCLVYRTRFRRNSVNLFVVFLAALEIVIVCVGVPMEMAVVALPLMFNSQVACKIARYVETASVCVVLLVLTAIAVDRYVKMSRPTNFLSPKCLRGLCIGTVLLALCLALPSLFVFGSKTVAGVRDVACDVDDSMSSHPVRIVYIVLLLLTFAVALVTKTVLYVLMFVRICRKKSAARGEKVSPARREYPRKHRFVTEDSVSSCGGGEETRRLPAACSASSGMGMATTQRSGRMSPGVDPARMPLKSGVKESARIGQGAGTTVDVQSNRMTWIFFLVSVMTVLTMVPFMVFRALLVLTDLLDRLQPLAVHVVYQLCVRLHLLHAPLIPLIYLCCNHNLRREAKHLLQNACLSCKRQPPTSNGHTADSHR